MPGPEPRLDRRPAAPVPPLVTPEARVGQEPEAPNSLLAQALGTAGLEWLAPLLSADFWLPEYWVPDIFLDWFTATGLGPPSGDATLPPQGPDATTGPAPMVGPATVAPPAAPSDSSAEARPFPVAPAIQPTAPQASAVEPGNAADVTADMAGDASEPAAPSTGPPTTAAAVKDRVDAASAGLSHPQVPQPSRSRAPIDATTDAIAGRAEDEVRSLRMTPASIVGYRPGHRRPPKPDPGPIPDQMAAVRAAMGHTLDPATLPPVTRSPRGTLPDLTQPVLTDLEIRAVGLGDAAILAMVTGSDDASLAERDKLLTVHDNLGRHTATAPQADVSGAVVEPAPPLSAPIVDEPVAGAGLTMKQRGLFALVVADLRADVTHQANCLLRSVRLAHSHFPGGALDRAFEQVPLTAGLLPEASQAVTAETDSLANALALTPDQLDEAVQLRREQVQQLRDAAAGATTDASNQARSTAAGADARKRATAQATASGVASSATADRAPVRPPNRTLARIEQAMADLREPVATELARLDKQLRQRERAIADAVRAQVSAIRLAQTADEIALKPAPGTRGTTQDRSWSGDVRRWADAAVVSLDTGDTSTRATLVAAATAQTETFKTDLRVATSIAVDALRVWGDAHVKAADTWWADLDATLGRWSSEAIDAGAQWENQQGQASRIALAQDLESIKRISALRLARANDEAASYISRLDGEAHAVVVALSGGGNAPDFTAALSAGIRERLRARYQAGWETVLEQAVMTMPIEENFTALDALLTVVQPNWKLEDVTAKIHKAVTRYRGHDEESIFEALGGLSPLAARMLRWYYGKTIGQSLDDALHGYGHVGHLSSDEMDTAHQLMRGDRVEGAIGAIHSALSGPGAEMGAVNRILRSLSPTERTAAITQYQIRYDQSLESELKDQWTVSKSEVDESLAIAHSDLTGASVIALQRSVKTIQTGSGYGGEYGADADAGNRVAVIDRGAAAGVYEQIRKDVEAEGAQKSWTSNQIEAEITVRSQELGARFDAQAADQWWVKNQPPGTTATEAAFALASPAGKDLLNGLATNDLVKIDVAKIRLEDEGLWASDAAINAVFRDQAARSLTSVQRDMGPIMQAHTEAQLRREEATFANAEQRVDRRMALERENAAQLGAMADDQTRTRMRELGSLYEIKSGRTLAAMVEDNMSFTAKEEALARVAQHGVLSNYQKLKYAIEGLGTDMPMLRSTLATMNCKELAEANAKWREEHDESLIEGIKGDTSGREQTDLVDMATYGVPQTAEEVVEAAERKLQNDQKAATTAGSFFTQRESEYAANEVKLLRTRLEGMRRSGTDSDAQWRATTAFDIAVDRANTAIELQREALDSITDLLANAAAIITAIVVGAALAPFTAGGSAVVAAAIISSVMATAVSIGIKQAMKGSAYGRGELATDLAIGAVDALVSALTAGLGHGLLGRAAGTATTVERSGLAQALSRLGPVGRAAAQSRGVVARGASRFAFLEGMDQSKNFAIRMIGRGTAQLIEQGVQAVPSSFVGSLLDESILTDPRGPALLLDNTISGTLQSTAMGLGLAAAHHVGTMGWHGAVHGTKVLIEGIRVMAPPEVRMPTGDVLSHVGTPTERLADFYDWRKANPGGTAHEFNAERRSRLIESWQLGAAEHQRVREARTELLSGLPAPERGRYADLPIRSVSDAEFARLTDHVPGDAQLMVREGQAVVVVREGAEPGAVAALLPAVQERVFPGTYGMTVEAALPRGLRDTPIRIDVTLPHDEIRVLPIPPTGPITGVEVVVGPGAHPIDVGLHADEITRVRRWTGRLGDARLALARFSEHLGIAPITPENRTRFEAAGELRKLGPLIEERLRRRALATDPATAADLERRTRHLLAQHERARRILSGELEVELRGYVAQEGEPAAATKAAPKPTAAEAIAALSELIPRVPELQATVVEARGERARVETAFERLYELPLSDIHGTVSEAFPDAGLGDPAEYEYDKDSRKNLRAALNRMLATPGAAPADVARRRGANEVLRKLTAYETQLLDLEADRLTHDLRVEAVEIAHVAAEREFNRWMDVLSDNPGAAAAAFGSQRTLMGVLLSSLLPAPTAPEGYVPHLLEGESHAKRLQHLYGLYTEAHMANRIAEDLHETVVEFGDKVGTNGADATSVDANGIPTLWDSKYRSSGVKFIESETFTVDSRIRGAVEKAIQALRRNPDGRLTPLQVATAIGHLNAGNFNAYTVTSDTGRTFHSAVKTEIRNFAPTGTEGTRVTVPWGNGK
jgi:hypothetical protein